MCNAKNQWKRTVRSECENGEKTLSTSIDIILDTVQHHKCNIHCYFSKDEHLACRTSMNKDKSGTVKHTRTFECFYCSTYFAGKNRYDRHIANCSVIPGITYKFHKQNLVTFESNLKYWCDLSLVAYCDFETATNSVAALDPKNAEMLGISCVIIFAFHPNLILDRTKSVRKNTNRQYLKC